MYEPVWSYNYKFRNSLVEQINIFWSPSLLRSHSRIIKMLVAWDFSGDLWMNSPYSLYVSRIDGIFEWNHTRKSTSHQYHLCQENSCTKIFLPPILNNALGQIYSSYFIKFYRLRTTPKGFLIVHGRLQSIIIFFSSKKFFAFIFLARFLWCMCVSANPRGVVFFYLCNIIFPEVSSSWRLWKMDFISQRDNWWAFFCK